MIISNKEAKKLVDEIFEEISKSKSAEDLLSITSKITFGKLIEKKMPPKSKFPRLNFEITNEDIDELIEMGVLTNDNKISQDAANNLFKNEIKLTSLEKILYSILWKNGDLGKEHHLISGVKKYDHSGKDGIVFYEFGRYISGQSNYILDQHTLRCLAVHKVKKDDEISNARKLQSVNSKHIDLINAYKEYYDSVEKTLLMEDKRNFFYHMDRLLFGAGKIIKAGKPPTLQE